ncbi:hypothetical protein B0H13DRAFT_1887655 [Mycena leptocephala]|nr:hypothetical protein B0H13DRAFT_1887655 [Mycena leptocephala]
MSQHSPADPTLALFTKRRRVDVACAHCRRRKVKCTTTESPPSSPCERCTKMGLSCEYVSVATQCAQSRSSPTGRGKALNLPRISTSPPTVTRPRNQFLEYCDKSSNAISTYSQQRNRALKAEPYSDLGIRLLAPSPFEFRHDIPDDVSDSKDTNLRPSYLSRSGPTTALHLPPLLDQKYYNKSNQYWSNLTVENTQHMPYPLDIYPPPYISRQAFLNGMSDSEREVDWSRAHLF